MWLVELWEYVWQIWSWSEVVRENLGNFFSSIIFSSINISNAHSNFDFAEDEHDVTWFKLKKGEDFECPVCTQVFEVSYL